jgi:hypothetical protein
MQEDMHALGNSLQYTLERRLRWSGCHDKEKNLCPCWEVNPIIQPIALSLYWVNMK